MGIREDEYENIVTKLEEEAQVMGLETYPFKIGWYNNALNDKRFEIPDDPETLAFIVISSPSMFEKTFLPYLENEGTDGKNSEIKDPLDRCMKEAFARLAQLFMANDYGIVAMHDFEISPINKRPKVLVQTAGHVAGAVRFYQQCDLKTINKSVSMNTCESQMNLINQMRSKKVFPVCLHPKYGGWFALRGVLIFKNVRVSPPLLQPLDPPMILKTEYDIANLLYLFNDHWRDSRYRDVGMPSDLERYSTLQQEYFRTEPSERKILISKITHKLD